jgi:hypothetical protein
MTGNSVKLAAELGQVLCRPQTADVDVHIMHYALEDDDSASGSMVRVQYLQTIASAWICDLQYGHSFVLVAELFRLARTTTTMRAIINIGTAQTTDRITSSGIPRLGMLPAPSHAFPKPGFIVAS